MSPPPSPPIVALQLGALAHEALARRLGPRFELQPLWRPAALDGWLAQRAAEARAVLTHSGGVPVDAALIARLPALEVVVNLGAGYESIDLDAARARGVAVANTAGANADDVAELALALLIALRRGLPEGDRVVREGRWRTARLPLARRVGGSRLGLLGMGHVGRAIAARAAAFGMQIAYCSRHARPDLPYRHEPELVRLAAAVDALVVAAPGGAATHHLVDRAVLDALGPQGVLVNVARGSIVDEAALVAALGEGRLGGAALDVFEHEPEVPPALAACANVLLQPHRGGATVEAFDAVVALAALNLVAHFDGREMPSRIA